MPKTTKTQTENRKVTRRKMMIEVDDGMFWRVDELLKHPDREKLVQGAIAVLEMQLKDVLGGMAPLFGREQLLAMCLKIINEDFDPDGPQTTSFREHDERGPIAAT